MLVICGLVSEHDKFDVWTAPNSYDCSLLFYQEKISLTKKVLA